jgi:Tfp pilus assembly protein PilF
LSAKALAFANGGASFAQVVFKEFGAIHSDPSNEAADLRAEAVELFHKAYDCQLRNELDRALDLYHHSVELYPTAEAYTFMGWAYAFQGQLEKAIRLCMKAIKIDPGYGNPYNDIGAYLIELGHSDKAVKWLERATRAPRYDHSYYAWYNLGRIHEAQREFTRAVECYKRSLAICPDYIIARASLLRLLSQFN